MSKIRAWKNSSWIRGRHQGIWVKSFWKSIYPGSRTKFLQKMSCHPSSLENQLMTLERVNKNDNVVPQAQNLVIMYFWTEPFRFIRCIAMTIQRREFIFDLTLNSLISQPVDMRRLNASVPSSSRRKAAAFGRVHQFKRLCEEWMNTFLEKFCFHFK